MVRMLRRFVPALVLALAGGFAFTGVSEAAKGPDANEVTLGTLLVAFGVMAFLGLIYLLKSALGFTRALPPEEPPMGEHH